MTSNDDTGDKLVATVRRTKTTAASETGASLKPRARGPAAPKPGPDPAAPVPAAARPRVHDPYRSLQRVWPD